MATPRIDSEIHAVLSSLLLSGRLPSGMRLGEMELAEAFDVSRERIRKVLHRLGAERLIELVPNRGAFVATPSLSAAREIYDARRILESGLLMTVANSLSEAQIAELDAHLAHEHEAAHRGDRARMVQLSGEFHLKLAEMSGNPFVVAYVRELVSRTSMLVALFEEGAAACGLSEHKQIVDALRARNGPLAAHVGAVHLSLIETRLKLKEPEVDRRIDLTKLIRQAKAARRTKAHR